MKTIYELLGRGSIHPFPARMAPSLAVEFLEGLGSAGRVLDPMVGSGTVLALARREGHHGLGFDLDPLAVLLSRVWTSAVNHDEVRSKAVDVLIGARIHFVHLSVRDAYPEGADDETRRFVRYWFDGYARRQLTALARAIVAVRARHVRDVLWCAFSRLIITKQAGASLAMDLSHSRPHKVFRTAPVKPFNRFEAAVERVVVNCLNSERDGNGPVSSVKEGDARALPLPDDSVDLILTSPPYLNAIDYLRCSKFSLVWMGYSLDSLRSLRSDSIGSEAASKHRASDLAEAVVESLFLRSPLPTKSRRVLCKYVDDMAGAMREAQRVLVPNGRAVYVVGENTVQGTFIKTSAIITALAESCGMRLVRRTTRDLPSARRYLPPPNPDEAAGLDARMRREVVLTFNK